MREYDAKLFANFLSRMLQWAPTSRAKANDLLSDPWLRCTKVEEAGLLGDFNRDARMSSGYHREWRRAKDSTYQSSTDEASSSSGSSYEDMPDDPEDQDDGSPRCISTLEEN